MRKLGFYPRQRIPPYEETVRDLGELFKNKSWNWGDKINVYEEMRMFIRNKFFVRKGKID